MKQKQESEKLAKEIQAEKEKQEKDEEEARKAKEEAERLEKVCLCTTNACLLHSTNWKDCFAGAKRERRKGEVGKREKRETGCD